MSFWTVLSCCFTTPKPSPHPIKTVSLNRLRVSALMDTGSTVYLIDSKLKKDILLKGSNPARAPILKLCGADGKELQNDGCYSIQITINSTSFWYNVIFFTNLKVPCVIGMDFLSKAGISIDTATNKIRLGKSKLAKGKTYSVYPVHNITLPAKSETLVNLTALKAFEQGYYYAKGARTLKVEEECSRRRSNEN